MATRLYFGNVTSGPYPPLVGNPAFTGPWSITTGAGRRTCYPLPQGFGSSQVASAADTATTTQDILVRQYISPPMDQPGTISGTIRGQLRAIESASGALACAQMFVWVCSINGATNRGTLYAFDTSALSSEFALAQTNRGFPRGSTAAAKTLTSLACQHGDRLVFEFGARFTNTVATSFTASLTFADNQATDLPVDETTTTSQNSWVELSQNIGFLTEYPVISTPRRQMAMQRASRW